MKHNKKKLLIILDELMKLFLKLGCTSITVHFDIEKDESIIQIRGKYSQDCKEHLKSLEHSLNCGRNVEMEECYWSISGSAEIDQGSELYIVGSMLDHCTVLFDDEYIEILAHRKP
ncbi:MAG: hypothetical protein R3Y09_06160 [Clostridia bacterium]